MKLSSFCAVALTCFFTTVSATIKLAAPSNPVSGGRSTITWTHDASDPAQFVLTLQLASDSWALGQFWEFVETKANRLDVTFLNTYPYVISTKSIYRLVASNQSNPDQIYSKSPTFRFSSPGSTVTTTTSSTTTNSTTTLGTSTRSSTTIKVTTASSISSNYTVPAGSSMTATPRTTTPQVTLQTTTTPLAVQPTTTTSPAPAETTSTTAGDPAGQTGGVLGDNTSAALRAGLSVSGGAGAAAVVAALVVGLASSLVQF